jgi:hypothetical protein
MKAALTTYDSTPVDTAEDAERVRAIMAARTEAR